jgi:malate dehydrogenase (oxaloacetate-decarboxylating)(NADP+)
MNYAHDHPFIATLPEAVNQLSPTILIGVSGQPKQFTREVIESMSGLNEQPVVFALSNPTSKSECTAEEAYTWSNGKAIFASGSPFDPVEVNGKQMVPGQGNNVYIFPGIGLGVAYSRSRTVTDEMFLEAARILASEVGEDDLDAGCVYPPLSKIRQVSLKIAVGVARIAIAEGLSNMEDSEQLEERIRDIMFDPRYPNYME